MNTFERFVKLNEKINQNDYYKQLEITYNKFINTRNHINLRNYH